jgi:hypothetical protein
MELVIVNVKGIYRDVLTAADGTLLYDSGWKSNTIVERCRILLAGFIRNDTMAGIQHLQVGAGDPDWDANGAPPPKGDETELVDPASPPIAFADLQVAYLNMAGTTLPPDDPPTAQIQITATLAPGYPAPLVGQSTYPLREFGLFGKFKEDTFYMINNVRHPTIHKEESTTLVRVVRLYF